MTGSPLTELTILTVDASTPGELTVAIDEHLQCPSCGHTGATWQIPLVNEHPAPPAGQRRRVEDPGG